MRTADRGEREEGKGKNGRLSSQKQAEAEVIQQKAGRKPGSEADERKRRRREAPVEQLWERSREGRKETDRKPSTRSLKGSTGNRAEEKVEDGEAERRNRALEKPLMRRGQEEGNGRTAG